jgi:RND family efflux transporter MFP subunit
MTMWILATQLFWGCEKARKQDAVASEKTAEINDLRQRVRIKNSEERSFSKSRVLEAKLEATQSAVLVPKSAGRVQDVHVRIGDAVSKGDVLLIVEDHDYRLGHQEAAANYELVQAQLAHAEKQRERFVSLHEEGVVTAVQLEEVVMGVSLAQGQLQRAKTGVQIAKSRIDGCRIVAPFSGVVIARNIEKGEMIGGPAQRPPLMIADISTLRVIAELDEQLAKNFSVGDKARLLHQEEEQDVLILRINGAVDPVIHTVRIEAEISNSEGKMRHGESTKLKVDTPEIQSVSTLRSALLGVKSGSAYIFVLQDTGTVERREVQYGESDDLFIPILSGLETGEKVLVSGHTRLEEGIAVIVVKD